MRISRLIFPLVTACLLSACTNAFHGFGTDMDQVKNWMDGSPDTWIGPQPTGYYGQNEPRLLKSQPLGGGSMVEWGALRRDSGSVYGDLSGGETLPGGYLSSAKAVPYNESVTIFPITDE